MSAKFEKLRIKLATMWSRWRLTWKEVGVILALAYFTPIGGSRAGTFHFPLVMFSHLIVTVLLIVWTVNRFRHGRSLPKTPLDLPLLVFYLLNVISTLFSTEPRLSLENLLHLTIFILIYYLVVDMLISGWSISSLVMPMLVVASVMIIAELLEVALWLGIWYAGTGELSPLPALNNYRRRIIMGPANVLAWYLVLLVPLALAQFMRANSRKAKMNMSVWAIGAILVFSSTLSRSGFVGMAAGLAAFAVLVITPRLQLRNKTLLTYLRMPTVIAGILLSILLGAVFSTVALKLADLRVGTIEVRFELWRAGLEMIVSRPLLGGGPGTFGYLFHQVPDFNRFIPDTFYNNAHNGYINIAAETGLPSLLMGLWLIAALAIGVSRSPRNPDDASNHHRLIMNACFAGIIGLLAATLFDVPWVFPLMTLHVILLTAIIIKPHSIPHRLTTQAARWLIPGALGVMAGILLWTDSAHYFQQRAIQAMDDDNLPAAIDALRKSISIDPFLSTYRFQLGVVQGYLALEELDETALHQAIAAFEAEISRGGDTAINNGNLAWLYRSAGETIEALSHMQRAATLAPRESCYQLSLGYLLEEVGNYQAASESYASAIMVNPALIDSGFWQVTAYRRDIKPDLLAQAGHPARPRGDGLPCREVIAAYDYASQVYHRMDLRADFWPDSIAHLPYDSQVHEYLELARTYRQTGESEQADELCQWLGTFYESGYLKELDEGDDKEWPCPDRRPHSSDGVE